MLLSAAMQRGRGAKEGTTTGAAGWLMGPTLYTWKPSACPYCYSPTSGLITHLPYFTHHPDC